MDSLQKHAESDGVAGTTMRRVCLVGARAAGPMTAGFSKTAAAFSTSTENA